MALQMILNTTQGEVKSSLSSCGLSNKLFHGRDTENVYKVSLCVTSKCNICTIYIQATKSPVPDVFSALADQLDPPWHFTISKPDQILSWLIMEQLSKYLQSSKISLFRLEVLTYADMI